MLKIPKVSFEKMVQVSKEFTGKEKKQEELTQNLQNTIEEFASEQLALLTMISKLSDLGESGYLGVATIVWKAIKLECANSELQSWMDIK